MKETNGVETNDQVDAVRKGSITKGADRRGPVGLSLFALALAGFGIGTTEFATMGILPDVANDLRISIPTAGHLISLYALGVVVGAPLLTLLGAQLRRKTLLTGLMMVFTLGNLASVLAPGFGTLAAARFLSGLPHGAYLGIASVVASSLVAPQHRARAVSMVLLGLTAANVLGVPLSTVLGQTFGWRATYLLVTVIGAISVGAILLWVPTVSDSHQDSIHRELGALRRPQVWLALLTGSIGFGGLFAVYSYIAPIMTDVAGLPAATLPLVLAICGLGMTIGTLVGGRLTDMSVMGAIYTTLASTIVVLLALTFTAHYMVPAVLTVFLIGAAGTAVVPALQTRLMDVSPDAQSLAGALNQSALNIANSLGAWLGGLAISAGYGYTSTAWVGVVLVAFGLTVAVVSGLNSRRSLPTASP